MLPFLPWHLLTTVSSNLCLFFQVYYKIIATLLKFVSWLPQRGNTTIRILKHIFRTLNHDDTKPFMWWPQLKVLSNFRWWKYFNLVSRLWERLCPFSSDLGCLFSLYGQRRKVSFCWKYADLYHLILLPSRSNELPISFMGQFFLKWIL